MQIITGILTKARELTTLPWANAAPYIPGTIELLDAYAIMPSMTPDQRTQLLEARDRLQERMDDGA